MQTSYVMKVAYYIKGDCLNATPIRRFYQANFQLIIGSNVPNSPAIARARYGGRARFVRSKSRFFRYLNVVNRWFEDFGHRKYDLSMEGERAAHVGSVIHLLEPLKSTYYQIKASVSM